MEEFNFQDHISEVKSGGLQAIVLGPSGSGKSHLLGTYPGKVLHLFDDAEHHGVKSSRKQGGEGIIPINWSQDGRGVDRSPEAAYQLVKRILSRDNGQALKDAGIECIGLDSIVKLLAVIRNTQEFVNRCETPKGGHNSYAEPDAYIDMMQPILRGLRTLSDQFGIDYVVLGDLEIQAVQDNGLIKQSKPRMPSFSVAENIVMSFPDIMMISRVAKKDVSKPLIQMGAGCSRVSKDQTGQIVKTIDFTPRIADSESVPAFIKADLSEVLKLKGR